MERRSANTATKKQHAHLYTSLHRCDLRDGERRRAAGSEREEQEGNVKREGAGSKRAWRTGGASGGGQVVVGGIEVRDAHAACVLEKAACKPYCDG
jgi:hypothetical protein